jgi:hypothetical protein
LRFYQKSKMAHSDVRLLEDTIGNGYLRRIDGIFIWFVRRKPQHGMRCRRDDTMGNEKSLGCDLAMIVYASRGEDEEVGFVALCEEVVQGGHRCFHYAMAEGWPLWPVVLSSEASGDG